MSGMWQPASRWQVTEALNDALERTRLLLLNPVRFERWLAFGILAFLDLYLAGGGAGRSGVNLSYSNSGSWERNVNVSGLNDALRWIELHLTAVILTVLAVLCVGGAVYAVVLWFGCRGQCMFARAVMLSSDRISEHWDSVREPAWSLFIFRLEILAFTLAFYLATGILALLMIHAADGASSVRALTLTLLPLIVVAVSVQLGIALVLVLLRNFVVPIMLRMDLTCWEAWGAFRHCAGGNMAALAGFLLIKLVYSLAFGFATLLLGCVTCCVGFLPVVHHVLFAPYYVFDRAFSLSLLRALPATVEHG